MTTLAVLAGIVVVGALLVVVARRAGRRRRARLEAAFGRQHDSVATDGADSPLLALVQGSLDLLGGTVAVLLRGRDRRDDDGTVTILFGDVEDSTRLNVALGDRRWADVLAALHEVTAEVVRGAGGRVVKTQGDGFMAVFAHPGDGARAAVALQEAVGNNPRIGEVLPVRIGLHCGEVVDRGGDVFGTEVVKAARIADQARGGQVLLSDELRERLEDAAVSGHGRTRLKGLPGRHVVHRLDSP